MLARLMADDAKELLISEVAPFRHAHWACCRGAFIRRVKGCALAVISGALEV